MNWKRKLSLDYDAIAGTLIVLVWQIMLFNWKEISNKRRPLACYDLLCKVIKTLNYSIFIKKSNFLP